MSSSSSQTDQVPVKGVVLPSSAGVGGQNKTVLTGPSVRKMIPSHEDGRGPLSISSSELTEAANVKELRSLMRSATIDGVDSVERQIGERILQNPVLLFTAGRLLALKVRQSPGIQSQVIDIVLELGSGKYPGLGASLTLALQQTTGLQFSEGVRVICNSWDDTEISEAFREARNLKVLIVIAARTPDLSQKVEHFIDCIKKDTGAGGDIVVKICALVSMEGDTTDKNVDGLLLIE